MAAVVRGCNWCKLLLSMLIIISLASPAGEFINKDPTSGIYVMELTGRDDVLTAKVTAYMLTASQERDLEKLEAARDDALRGDDKASQERLEDERGNYFSEIDAETEPLEGVDVYFFYHKKYTPETEEGLAVGGGETVFREELIPGCDPAPPTDSEGKTTCTVPEEIYTYETVRDAKTLSMQGCVQVFANFEESGTGEPPLDEYKETIMVCGRDATTLGVIAGMVNAALLSRLTDPLCLPSMIMAGLLLASMFFAGRSPHSLMDITTPLLPKAKTITYGGLTMGVGFGRMKGHMAEMATSLQRSAKATMPELMRLLRQRGVSRTLLDEITNSKASNTVKLLAMRALLAGKDRAFVRRILNLRKFGWVEKDEEAAMAEEYGKILSELREDPSNEALNRKDGLHDRVMGLVDMDIQNHMQIKAFDKATGDVPRWIGKGVGKTLGRIPLIGEGIKGATASLVFGARRMPMMYSSALRGAIRGIDRVTTGGKNIKRIQMTVDRRGRKASRFNRWLALSKEERKLVTLYDNFDKGSADYKRLMKEAERDVINYLLGCIMDHYFVDRNGKKVNLTRDQVMRIGLEGPDDLLFQNFHFRGFRAIENRLRAILSDASLSDVQKAAQIMGLMNQRGIRFDRRALAALRMLRDIERDIPQSMEETRADFDSDEDFESVANSHRYVRLRRYLEEQFHINDPIDHNTVTRGDAFTFMVGREQLHDSAGGDYTFGTFFRSTYRRILEDPTSVRAANRTLLQDTGDYTFLRIVSERFGLLDPRLRGLGMTELGVDVRKVMENAERWMRNLAIAGGFSGVGKNIGNVEHLISELYSPGGRGKGDLLEIDGHHHEHGPRKGMWRLDMHAHWRTERGPMRGAVSCVEEQAYGEVKRAHMVPKAVQDMMDARYNAGGKLSFADSEKIRMKELVQSHLFNRLKGIMEQDNPNTYFTSKGEFDRFLGLWDSYRARIFDTMKSERGYPYYTSVKDSEIKQYTKKPLSLEDVSKGVWLRLREGQFVPFVTEHATKLGQADRIINARYYIKRQGRWSEFAPDTLLKGKPLRELMFGTEGPLLGMGLDENNLPTVKNLPGKNLESFTSIMQGFADARRQAAAVGRRHITRADLAAHGVTENGLRRLFSNFSSLSDGGSLKQVRGCGAAVMRLFAENGNELRAVFGRNIRNIAEIRNTRLREAVGRESLLSNYLHAQTESERNSALNDLKAWAAAGTPKEDRTTKLALLLYHNGRQSGNWRDFNEYNEVIRLLPAMGDLPNDMRGWDAKQQVPGVRTTLKRMFYSVKDVLDPHLKNATMGLEQYMLSTFGSQTNAEYEGSMTSELFRQTGGKFAAKLAAGEFGNTMDRNSTAMNEYNRLVDQFLRYHSVWDETITRDPRGNSSAIGNAFIFSSFFHMGPATAYGPAPYRRWSYRGFNKPWYSPSGLRSSLMDLQFSPFAFNYAVGSPFLLAYRSYITNRWGFLSKYDRSYGGMGARGMLSNQEAARGGTLPADRYMSEQRTLALVEQQRAHDAQMQRYEQDVTFRAAELQRDRGFAHARAVEEARRELIHQMPTQPGMDFDRNTLRPFNNTPPRFADSRRSMLNWFYSSIDPRATTFHKSASAFLGSPMMPFYMVPFNPLQNYLNKNAYFLMNRADNTPYYDRPTNPVRRAMMRTMGPMVDRGYGGAEMQRGVTRSTEDSWMFQSGVNAIWGNANPGVSYVDFSQNIHVDPRAANHMRYESRFRPFFKYDKYIERQANLGIIKRDIDPTSMIMERNSEIQSYKFLRGGKIGDNSLFRFANPALQLLYFGRAQKQKIDSLGYSIDSMMQNTLSNSGMSRGGKIVYAADRFLKNAASAPFKYVKKKVTLGTTKSLVHCGHCGATHAAGSACTACSKKIRCPHCHSMCDPFQNHTCSFGLQRNLKFDQLRGDKRIDRELERRRKWGRAA